MWNLSLFREVDLFHRKMLTVPALEISWNLNIFSKFTKFHQTCRTYLNHHQKHACEIWANSEKLTYFTEKCRQCRPFEIWNFNIFSKFTKFHQTCRTYLNHHQKHACEIWAHSEKSHRIMTTVPALWNIMKFQSSSNFIKLAEHIGIIIISEKFFHRKMLTVPALEISWNFNIFQRFTKFHKTCSTYWTYH